MNKQAINKWLYDTGLYLSQLQADENSSLPTPPPTISVTAWAQLKKKLPLLDNMTSRQRDPIVRRMVKILDSNVQTATTCVTDISAFREGVQTHSSQKLTIPSLNSSTPSIREERHWAQRCLWIIKNNLPRTRVTMRLLWPSLTFT